jgi:phosphoenolpyruvate-protein kinase (PTS system EI component)
MKWADETRRLRVRANADTAQDARKAREMGAEGIGLCRTEHMFFKDFEQPEKSADRQLAIQEMIVADDPRPAAKRSTSCARSSGAISPASSRPWTAFRSRFA